MRISIEYDHVSELIRLLEALRTADAADAEVTLDKHVRRSLDRVAGADLVERGDALAQATRVWAWLTPRTRRILASSDTWHERGAERLKRILDRVAERAERATHRALAEAAGKIDGGGR